MKFTILFLLLCVILYSCNTNDTETGKHDRLIIDLDQAKRKMLFTDVVDSVHFIQLETKDECLIGAITKLQITDSLIVILDSPPSQGQVLVFNRRGDFIRKIGSIGQGPTEYLLGLDFQLFDDRIEILDNSTHLVIYNLDGQFIEKKKLESPAFKFAHNDRGHVMVGAGADDMLLVFDNQLKMATSHFPFKNAKINKLTLYPLWVNNGDIFYTQAYDNMVYKMSNGVPIPYLYMDYKEKAIPYEKLSKKEFDFSQEGNYAFTKFILETDAAMMIVTVYQDQPYVSIVDKNDRKVFSYLHNFIHNDITGETDSYPVGTAPDNYFVYNVNPSSLLNSTNVETERAEEIHELMSSIAHSSNPILMLTKFKPLKI